MNNVVLEDSFLWFALDTIGVLHVLLCVRLESIKLQGKKSTKNKVKKGSLNVYRMKYKCVGSLY